MNPYKITFQKSIEIVKKKLSSKNRSPIAYLYLDLTRYKNYIKKIQAQNPDISLKELQGKLLDDFHFNLTPKVFESGFSFENYMDLRSCKYLQEHFSEFDPIYKRVSEKDYTPPISNESFNDYLESYVYYSIYCRNTDISQYARSGFNADMLSIADSYSAHYGDSELKFKQLEKYIKTACPNKFAQRSLINCAKIDCFGPKYFLSVDQKIIEKELQNDLTVSILELLKTLDELGVYERTEILNEKNLRTFQFPEFQTNSSGNNMYVSLSNLQNHLANLSIDDLMVLNTFWLNRYIKEIDSYADCISVINECNLLEELLSLDKLPENFITADEYKYISQKKTLLRPFITDYILKQGHKYQDQIEHDPDKKYITFSYEGAKKYVSGENFEQEYHDYFSEHIKKSKNNSCDDIILYSKLFNPSIAAYSQKTDYLSALITDIESNTEIVNAGLIPTSYSKDKTHVNLPYLVGIGIDTKLTYPVREHISLIFLRDFVKSSTGSSIIPIYEGAQDFSNPFGGEDSFVSAQLVLPFSSKQLELLKRKVRTNDYSPYNKNFIQHMYFLANPQKIPDSFISEKQITSKTKKKKSLFKRRYVDLDDGQIYTKSKTGVYEKISPILEKGIDDDR